MRCRTRKPALCSGKSSGLDASLQSRLCVELRPARRPGCRGPRKARPGWRWGQQQGVCRAGRAAGQSAHWLHQLHRSLYGSHARLPAAGGIGRRQRQGGGVSQGSVRGHRARGLQPPAGRSPPQPAARSPEDGSEDSPGALRQAGECAGSTRRAGGTLLPCEAQDRIRMWARPPPSTCPGGFLLKRDFLLVSFLIFSSCKKCLLKKKLFFFPVSFKYLFFLPFLLNTMNDLAGTRQQTGFPSSPLTHQDEPLPGRTGGRADGRTEAPGASPPQAVSPRRRELRSVHAWPLRLPLRWRPPARLARSRGRKMGGPVRVAAAAASTSCEAEAPGQAVHPGPWTRRARAARREDRRPGTAPRLPGPARGPASPAGCPGGRAAGTCSEPAASHPALRRRGEARSPRPPRPRGRPWGRRASSGRPPGHTPPRS